jgi:hypothetical protein
MEQLLLASIFKQTKKKERKKKRTKESLDSDRSLLAYIYDLALEADLHMWLIASNRCR